jgi:hypothetical protein
MIFPGMIGQLHLRAGMIMIMHQTRHEGLDNHAINHARCAKRSKLNPIKASRHSETKQSEPCFQRTVLRCLSTTTPTGAGNDVIVVALIILSCLFVSRLYCTLASR